MASVLKALTLPLSLAAFALAAAPLFLTMPTVAQTSAHLQWAYRLDVLGLPLTLGVLIVTLVGLVAAWGSGKWIGRAGLLLGVLLAAAAVWVSGASFAEMMFSPLDESRYIALGEADHVQDEDLVLGVQVGEQPLIYPVAIVGYHHILNERLAGEPFVVTY
jgi:hypothetical protein